MQGKARAEASALPTSDKSRGKGSRDKEVVCSLWLRGMAEGAFAYKVIQIREVFSSAFYCQGHAKVRLFVLFICFFIK